MGFPGSSVGKGRNAGDAEDASWVQSPGWEDPLEEGMATYSSILLGELTDRGAR